MRSLVGAWNHGNATVHKGIACWSVQGLYLGPLDFVFEGGGIQTKMSWLSLLTSQYSG